MYSVGIANDRMASYFVSLKAIIEEQDLREKKGGCERKANKVFFAQVLGYDTLELSAKRHLRILRLPINCRMLDNTEFKRLY